MFREKPIARARRLRRDQNGAEERAWTLLRRLRAEGFPVRRQHPVGRFIVDFAIVRARIVVEIDGGVHDRPDVAAWDAARDESLARLGWRVLRIGREAVFEGETLLMLVRHELGVSPPSPACGRGPG